MIFYDFGGVVNMGWVRGAKVGSANGGEIYMSKTNVDRARVVFGGWEQYVRADMGRGKIGRR